MQIKGKNSLDEEELSKLLQESFNFIVFEDRTYFFNLSAEIYEQKDGLKYIYKDYLNLIARYFACMNI
jgi:hypothetical protein